MSRLLRWLLTLFIFFLPVQFDVGPARAAPSDLFVIAYAVIGITSLRLRRHAWSVWHFGLIGVFLIGVFQAATRDGALTTYVFLNKFTGLAVLFISYAVITSAADSWEKVRWMLRTFVLAVGLHAAVSAGSVLIAQALGQNPLPWMNYLGRRASGMLIDPNAFGGMVMVALVIHATTFFGGRPLLKGWAGYLTMGALALALLLTLSRTAWIGMTAAALFGVVLRPKLVAVYAGAALAAAALIIVFVGSTGADTFARTANRENTTQQRLDQINQALPMIAEHPFFGSGLGAFIERNGWILHNTTFWMLTEFGLIGLTVYIGFILWFFANGLAATALSGTPAKSIIVGLMCAHLGMLAVSVGIEAFYQRHWWFAMALLASSYSIATELARNRIKLTVAPRSEVRSLSWQFGRNLT